MNVFSLCDLVWEIGRRLPEARRGALALTNRYCYHGFVVRNLLAPRVRAIPLYFGKAQLLKELVTIQTSTISLVTPAGYGTTLLVLLLALEIAELRGFTVQIIVQRKAINALVSEVKRRSPHLFQRRYASKSQIVILDPQYRNHYRNTQLSDHKIVIATTKNYNAAFPTIVDNVNDQVAIGRLLASAPQLYYFSSTSMLINSPRIFIDRQPVISSLPIPHYRFSTFSLKAELTTMLNRHNKILVVAKKVKELVAQASGLSYRLVRSIIPIERFNNYYGPAICWVNSGDAVHGHGLVINASAVIIRLPARLDSIAPLLHISNTASNIEVVVVRD